MFIRETGQESSLGLGSTEGCRHFESRLLPMVTGPLIGLAYIIVMPLIGAVMVILLGTYQSGRVPRALLKR